MDWAEVQKAEQILSNEGFFAVILWHFNDLEEVMDEAGVETSEQNVQKFLNSRAPQDLEERSVEEGHEILKILVDMVFDNYEEV